jgi:hypothetical protein
MEKINSQPDIGKKNCNRLLIFVAGLGATFLPTMGQNGYSTMLFLFAGCTVIYFITAAFFLRETKRKPVGEIEEHFESGAGLPGQADASKASGQNN